MERCEHQYGCKFVVNGPVGYYVCGGLPLNLGKSDDHIMHDPRNPNYHPYIHPEAMNLAVIPSSHLAAFEALPEKWMAVAKRMRQQHTKVRANAFAATQIEVCADVLRTTLLPALPTEEETNQC